MVGAAAVWLSVEVMAIVLVWVAFAEDGSGLSLIPKTR